MMPDERIVAMLDIQDRANMVAINFAGKTISSGDGTYDLLRYDVANAIREIVTEAIEEDRKTRECCKTEREACAKIADSEAQDIGPYQNGQVWQRASEEIAKKIRAWSEGDNQKGD